MRLSSVELAAFAGANDAGRVCHRRWLVKTLPKGVAHEGPWCCVMPADSSVYVVEELDAFLDGDAALQNPGDAALVELSFDQDEGLSAPMQALHLSLTGSVP